MQKVAITGATGFVGLALTRELCRIGHDVVALIRASTEKLPSEVSQVLIGDLTHLIDGFGYGFAHHDRAGAEDSQICGSDLKKSENDKSKGRRNEVKSVYASGAKQSSAAVEGGDWTAAACGLAETSNISSDPAKSNNLPPDHANKSVIARETKQSSADVESGDWTARASGLAETSEINSSFAETSNISSDSAKSNNLTPYHANKSVIARETKQSSAAVEGGDWTSTASGLAETSHVNSGLAEKVSTDSNLESTQIKDRLLTELNGVEVVVHTAARTHVMKETSHDAVAEFRRINVGSTIALARLAAEAGVKRFVFLSSIKVNGERTSLNQAFAENDFAMPEDDYGRSKVEAEQALMQIADATGMEVVIIRPPLVYGPNAKGNFASLLKWVKRGVPLPLGAVNNQRSFIALDNLVDFISCCLVHPKAANEVFVISDGEDVSTTELLQKVANAVGRKARLIPVPVSWMRLAAKLTGKVAIADRLFGSLRVDISKARQLLAWKPKVTMQQQLESMASQAGSTESSGGGGFPPSRE